MSVATLWLTAPGAWQSPGDIVGEAIAAAVPGTVASAFRDAGLEFRDFDAYDAWYRLRLPVPPGDGPLTLRFDGVATGAEVWVDSVSQTPTTTALRPHRIVVQESASNELEVVFVCRALTTRLARKVPRPRWKTRLVGNQNLRFVRTPLVGRMPAFSPGPAPVGPFRPIVLERANLPRAITSVAMRGDDGTISVTVYNVPAGSSATLCVGDASAPLLPTSDPTVHTGTLLVPSPARWWPHTHGSPTTFAAHVEFDQGAQLSLGNLGFRSVEVEDSCGLSLIINGVRVFARGASWMPLDVVSLSSSTVTLRAELTQARDAGVNLLRIPGTSCYETSEFHDLCDELGIMVWQEVLLANLDYPTDTEFSTELGVEVEELLLRLGPSPSLVVVGGGSEIEQQATMWGHPPDELLWPLQDVVIPAVVTRLRPDVVYVRNSPTGGTLPFSVASGVAHYFGVGAYLRPLADARRAAVGFAAECLAFANISDPLLLDDNVPRDVGASWDFADVRDHYLALLFSVDAKALRQDDLPRYIALSSVVTGEVMAATLAEWRRAQSVTRGALIWYWRDTKPGSGFGVVSASGEPKAAYWFVRRAFAPLALFATDEGQDGVALHLVNDGAISLPARLRVRGLRDGGTVVIDQQLDVELAAQSTTTSSIEKVLGRFVDAAYAYRFGPPGYDAFVITLHDPAGQLLADTVYFPTGIPTTIHDDLGLSGSTIVDGEGRRILTLQTQRLAYAVSITAPGYVVQDNYVNVLPGEPRRIALVGKSDATLLTLIPINGLPVLVTL